MDRIITRVQLVLVVFSLIFCLFPLSRACADSLTLTTYYPSPSGNYQDLSVAGNLGIGTTSSISRFALMGTGFIGANGMAANDGSGYALQISGPNAKTSASFNTLLMLSSSDALASNPLDMRFYVTGNATAGLRYGEITVEEYGAGNYRNLVLQAPGGNVGIGSVNPTEKLSVNGKVKAASVVLTPYASKAALDLVVASSKPGEIAYAASEDKVYYSNGTIWKGLGGSGGVTGGCVLGPFDGTNTVLGNRWANGCIASGTYAGAQSCGSINSAGYVCGVSGLNGGGTICICIAN